MKEPLTAEQRELFARHSQYAEWLADRRVKSCLPPEDRRQEAYIGLMHAAREFDLSLGFKFQTFAHRRIVGAIIDAERRPDSALVKTSRMARNRGEREVRALFADSTYVETVTAGGNKKMKLLSSLVFTTSDPPPACEDRDAIDAALAGLPARDARIAAAYWLHGFTMKQAAELVGVSESRVSQILSRVVERLRRHTALSHYAKGA